MASALSSNRTAKGRRHLCSRCAFPFWEAEGLDVWEYRDELARSDSNLAEIQSDLQETVAARLCIRDSVLLSLSATSVACDWTVH